MKKILLDKRGFILLIIVLVLPPILFGCTKMQGRKDNQERIQIAIQFGLAYAPLEIMKQQKILEKNLPGVEIEWKQLGNTAAIREAMLSGDLDAGFMAIPPFLIGWDKGMEWKICCGLSKSPVSLVTWKENIKSIRDFTKEDRIAMPQPGSVQDILLAMACGKGFDNPRKFEGQIITLSHPDGMNALLTRGDVTAHFTAPPYLSMELEEPGVHEILKGNDVMEGDFTFIVGVTTDKFYDNSPELYEGFIASIKESADFINDNPEEAAHILSQVYDMPEEDILEYLHMEGVEYGLNVEGTKKFAGFMKKNGYISRDITNERDIFQEDVEHEN
ncbi:alkanesulfonate transporter substrate-binding subunit [Oxobacter pfennigii]|uniref:Alkanesulfonate transporter substrate-binding subunit n=1 Tax=Oxobacter pfennigii TaxID=36849 RepID=A0A0P9AIM3_9CLOT|nr:ABC transporter substrate-binding protein [Oxobacter pfennigii]KPU45317.1 alkanesulfonate transporter substrate-binding subunit [Oxobacter pfennigii]